MPETDRPALSPNVDALCAFDVVSAQAEWSTAGALVGQYSRACYNKEWTLAAALRDAILSHTEASLDAFARGYKRLELGS